MGPTKPTGMEKNMNFNQWIGMILLFSAGFQFCMAGLLMIAWNYVTMTILASKIPEWANPLWLILMWGWPLAQAYWGKQLIEEKPKC